MVWMNIDVMNVNILFLSNNSSSIGCTSIPFTDITDVVVSVVRIEELAIEELPLIWRSSARILASFNSCNLDNLDVVKDGGILRCAARFRASDIEFAFDNELLFLRSDFSFCSGLLLFRRLVLFCWDAVISLVVLIILSVSPKKEAVVVVASEGEGDFLSVFLFNFIATKQKYTEFKYVSNEYAAVIMY